MSLLNVKLKPDDVRRAKELRKAGVTLSEIVRRAIREEHERRIASRRSRLRPSLRMAAIYAALPDPESLEPRAHDVHDAAAARAAIRATLTRRVR